MIRRLATGFTALMAVLAVSLSWAPSAEAYDPQVKPQPWAYEKGLIPPEARGLRDGLVQHTVFWGGAGGTRDISGRGRDGTLAGDPTWVAGQHGLALAFDGAGDVVDLGAASGSPVVGATELTVVCLVKFNSRATNDRLWTLHQSAAPDVIFGINTLDVDELFAVVSDDIDNRFRLETASAPLSDGAWMHLVFVWRGANDGDWYIDGAKQASSAPITETPSSVRSADENEGVGARTDGTTPDLESDSEIADFRLYDRALTDGEVATLARSPFADVWPEYAQQPTDGGTEEVTAAAPQIIIISWITGLMSLTLLAYMRRRKDYERSGFWR